MELDIVTVGELKAPTFDVTVDAATKLNLHLNNSFSPQATVHVHNPDGKGSISGDLKSQDTLTVNFPGGANSLIKNVTEGAALLNTFDHNAG